MGKKSKIIMGLATAAMIPAILTGCGHKEHDPKDEWKNDATHHWHECEGKKCEEKLDKAEHEAQGAWLTSETHHWKDCECGYDMDYATHTYDQEVANQTYLKEETDTTNVYYKSCICGQKGTETFSVNKTVTTLENVAMPAEIIYGDNYEVNYSTNSNGQVTLRWFKGSKELEHKPTDAGNNYKVQVSIAGNSQYTAKESELIPFEIKKFKLQSETAIEFEYNKGVEFFTTFDTFAGGEIRLDLAFNNEAVGTKESITNHSIKVNGISEKNSNFDISELTFEIVKKKLSIIWQDNTTPFKFIHNKAIVPTFEIEGVCDGDEIDISIQKLSGDNTMYGKTFTFEALTISGANQDCYDIEESTKESYTYTIADIDSVTVGQSKDIDYILGETLVPYSYYKINLTKDTYYYFNYDTDYQGAIFDFDFYLAEDKSYADVTREVGWTTGGGNSRPTFNKSAFMVKTTGEYYIVVTRTDNEYEGTFTIALDEHTEVNEYGFCTRDCGTYRGETVETTWNTLTLKAGETKYFRFKSMDYTQYPGGQYKIQFKDFTIEENVNEFKVYARTSKDTFELIPNICGDKFIDVIASSYDGYYYIVVSSTAGVTNGAFYINESLTKVDE